MGVISMGLQKELGSLPYIAIGAKRHGKMEGWGKNAGRKNIGEPELFTSTNGVKNITFKNTEKEDHYEFSLAAMPPEQKNFFHMRPEVACGEVKRRQRKHLPRGRRAPTDDAR